DIAFHRLMVEAAGNMILEQTWKSLGVEGRITISLYGTYVGPEEAGELHVRILEAIRSGKPGAAGRAARKHVEAFARIARNRAAAGHCLPGRPPPRSPGCSSQPSRCVRRSSASAR